MKPSPYGNDPLPSEALEKPFTAFPSWFLRIECERCGKTVMRDDSPTNLEPSIRRGAQFDEVVSGSKCWQTDSGNAVRCRRGGRTVAR